MIRRSFLLGILLLCLPPFLVAQVTRLKEMEVTGTEYRRHYFSYFDTLLSEVRTYDQNEKWIKRVIFTYNEDYTLPVAADVYENGQIQHWYIRYTNGRVAQIALVGIETPLGYLFHYEKNGALKSIQLIGQLKGTWNYAFEGGNLTAITFKMPRSSPMKLKDKTYQAYDTHTNYWSLTTATMWKHRAILATFFGDECWSSNNPLQLKEENEFTHYAYTYDSLGNPAQITIKAPGKMDSKLKLIYSSR